MKNRMGSVKEQRVSKCATHNISKYRELSEKMLNALFTLPCGCEEVALRELISAYTCTSCKKICWYSFCLEKVVSEGETWHCDICGACY